ncbi:MULTISPECIES: NACHT domain-containing protein [unclassified Streptomyces]|uniref:NACHT domain-containing protein n=1 Tax=unclassified Streptomyces TaxID=2593676 RepID=UPI002366E3E0|nr:MULTISPECIES: NACHT domain-containing protein [unclassified Streptomyces]MDF3146785.1 NACHT domain-containing protein [Streptomyces sp. T21Q-yed]WDF40619.1 NACHT domain-containing protein [Streptomyces sp. T12]
MLSAVVAAGSGTPIINTPVVTAGGAVIAALVAGAFAIWQTRRNRRLEREKIELQEAANRRLKEHEWEREDRARAQEEEQEQARAADQSAARRSSLVTEADTYCARLAQELSTLKILDMSRPLRLDRLYVQVRVQEQQPLRFVREEELGERDRNRAGDGTRRESLATDTATSSSHTYAPIDALQRYQRIVVVGDPGAGKTTMLRHLALRMASQSEGEALPELPAYIELFRFVESGHDSLLDYVAEHWADQYGFADAREYVAEKLADGTAALLLDGLDEVLGGESAEDAAGAYGRVTDEIARLATRFPRALIATTCRRHGWQGGLQQFQVLEALDFEWAQIETFIANWFGERDRRRSGLVRALSGNGRLQTLAANPLLLSLIAIVYERDLELPERRAALYRRCVEVLLREWDAHRKVTRYSRFTTDRKQDLLKQIAWHYHQRGRRYFPEDDLLGLIGDFLPTIDLPRTDSRAILDEIAAQYGLLKAQAHGWYGFLHLTLQEHFAATALLEQGAAGIERAVASRYDPWWEEVILLLAGALPDATPLLSGVLQPEGREADAELLHLPHDDLFHTDLLLAARCLTGSPRVADVALRRQIVRTVWQLLESSPYEEERLRAAQAIVGVLGSEQQLSEVVGYIGDDQKGPDVRAALVDALAGHGGRKVGERLLGVFTLQPALSGRVRGHLIKALGTLHVEAAVPVLLQELTDLMAGPNPTGSEEIEHVCTLVRALGAAGGPADVLLRAVVEKFGGWQARQAVRDSLPDVGDSDTEERLLELLTRDDDWYFERQTLAEVYLDIAGDRGAGALLDLIRSDQVTEFQKMPMMAALVVFAGQGHGWAHRDALLAVAGDTAAAWQLRWLALECLDHSPGSTAELQALLDSPDPHICAAAAATSAAWGTPLRLHTVRRAILSGAFSPDLDYERGRSHSWAWRGRISRRLGTTLSPYGDFGVVQHFFDRAATGRGGFHDGHAAYWLEAFAPEAAMDACLLRLREDTQALEGSFPPKVPRSRAHAVLRYGLDNLEAGSPVAADTYEALLRSVAGVADDAETVAGLLRFIDPALEPPFPHDAAHSAAYAVSRRARVRVLPDHTIVPLPSAG